MTTSVGSVLAGQVSLDFAVTTASLASGASQTAVHASVMAAQRNVSHGQAAVCIAGATQKEISVRDAWPDTMGTQHCPWVANAALVPALRLLALGAILQSLATKTTPPGL